MKMCAFADERRADADPKGPDWDEPSRAGRVKGEGFGVYGTAGCIWRGRRHIAVLSVPPIRRIQRHLEAEGGFGVALCLRELSAHPAPERRGKLARSALLTGKNPGG